jgi:hypothetical protein
VFVLFTDNGSSDQSDGYDSASTLEGALGVSGMSNSFSDNLKIYSTPLPSLPILPHLAQIAGSDQSCQILSIFSL